MGVYSDRLKRGVLGTGQARKGGGGLRHRSCQKGGSYARVRLEKKGGGGVLGTGQVKKGGGSLLRHVRVLNIYASADPPGVDHHDHIL